MATLIALYHIHSETSEKNEGRIGGEGILLFERLGKKKGSSSSRVREKNLVVASEKDHAECQIFSQASGRESGCVSRKKNFSRIFGERGLSRKNTANSA